MTFDLEQFRLAVLDWFCPLCVKQTYRRPGLHTKCYR